VTGEIPAWWAFKNTKKRRKLRIIFIHLLFLALANIIISNGTPSCYAISYQAQGLPFVGVEFL
jgi:hypothetical protein